MTMLVAVFITAFGSLLSHTSLFDDGPYAFVQEHKTLEACQIATHGTDDICTTEGLISQYVIERGTETKANTGELPYIECDNWMGCYLAERVE
jgi:hypothetical protein